MQYLTARWLAVKTLPPQKIQNLHRLEKAVHNYAAYCKKNFPKDKTTPPLWWQCAGAFFGPDLRAVFNRSFEDVLLANAQLARTAEEAGIDLRSVFTDINLMHRLDSLALTPRYPAA